MEQGKIVYENNGFIITEHPRMKEYEDPELNNKDKVYRIKITGTNQPTFNDICEALYFLLKNKYYEGAFQQYKGQVLDTIKKAENTRLENWM